MKIEETMADWSTPWSNERLICVLYLPPTGYDRVSSLDDVSPHVQLSTHLLVAPGRVDCKFVIM
jgi:hypothetical protein